MGEIGYDFTGRHVVVTGGSRGIGLAVARAFHRAGAHVAVTGTFFLTSSYAEPLADFTYHQLDLTDADAIARVANAVGPVDVLVHAAGARLPLGANPSEVEALEHAARLGLVGHQALTSRLKYRLAESSMPGGAAVVQTHAARPWYALAHGEENANAALADHTARLGAAWGRSGIRVNAVVAPVVIPHNVAFRVDTDTDGATTLTRTRPEALVAAHGLVPGVTQSALYLASRGSSYLTGQTLVVNTPPRG